MAGATKITQLLKEVRQGLPDDVKALKKRNKVCIMGTASTRSIAPYESDEYDFWAVGPIVTYGHDVKLERIDHIFELHKEKEWKEPQRLSQFMEQPCGFVMIRREELLGDRTVEYPYDAVRSFFYRDSMYEKVYFTNSISWMIALAIVLDYDELHLYGVHMSSHEEFAHQKPSCEYLLGFAQALGKYYYLPYGSDILRTPFEYGFEEPVELHKIQDTIRGLKGGLEEVQRQEQAMRDKRLKQEGALWAAQMINRNAGGRPDV